MADEITVVGPLIYPDNPGATRGRTVLVRCVGPDGQVAVAPGGDPIPDRQIVTDPDDGSFEVSCLRNTVVDEASGFTSGPGSQWLFTIGVTPAVTWSLRITESTPDGVTIPAGHVSNARVRPYGQTILRVPTSSLDPVPGPPGPSGTRAGRLVDRPAVPDEPMVWIATDSDDPISVAGDDAAWSTVPVPVSRTLTAVKVESSPADVPLTNGESTVLPWSVTEDITHPGGLVTVTATSLVCLPGPFDTAGQKADGVALVESDDGGSTWSTLGVYQTMRPTSAWFAASGPLVGVSQQPQGIRVRYGLSARTDSDDQILSGLIPPWFLVVQS